jgi:DNA-binding ferritin-like protein
MGSMKGGVSVVGERSSATGGSAASSSSRSLDYSPPSDYAVRVNAYRDRLAPLRANLEEIDRNILKAKEAKGNASEDTAAWIRVYEGRRSGVLAKIDSILDEARRHDVTPGDLR